MCTHLIKRGSRYYIRRRVPLDLVSILGKSEITKALGTSDRTEAVALCRLAGVKLDAEWGALREKQKTSVQLAKLTTAAVRLMREADERDAEDGQEFYFRHVVDEGEREVAADKFEAKIQRRVALEREVQRRISSDRTSASTTPKPVEQRPVGRTLLDVVDGWERERQPQRRTVGIAQRVARRFRELVGPVAITGITRQHVIQFKDALLAADQTAVNTDKILTMVL